jgi:hypothetical protein
MQVETLESGESSRSSTPGCGGRWNALGRYTTQYAFFGISEEILPKVAAERIESGYRLFVHVSVQRLLNQRVRHACASLCRREARRGRHTKELPL